MCNEASLTRFVQLERVETATDKKKKFTKKKIGGVIDAASVLLREKKAKTKRKKKTQIGGITVQGSGLMRISHFLVFFYFVTASGENLTRPSQ